MKQLQILKILANREDYLKKRQEELNQNQSKDLDYNERMRAISYSLNEISLISQIIFLTWDIIENNK